MSIPDMTGQRFGGLTVISRAPNMASFAAWNVRCDCGIEKSVRGSVLRKGDAVSCGCAKAARLLARSKTHGKSGSAAYSVWRNMKNRCELQTTTYYSHYGARGIRVCERWQSFENFRADMGEPNGRRIERLDNDGNYEPANCVWVDAQAQANNRRSNVFLEFAGKRMTIAEWARETGLGRALNGRLQNGWSVERALTTPKRE